MFYDRWVFKSMKFVSNHPGALIFRPTLQQLHWKTSNPYWLHHLLLSSGVFLPVLEDRNDWDLLSLNAKYKLCLLKVQWLLIILDQASLAHKLLVRRVLLSQKLQLLIPVYNMHSSTVIQWNCGFSGNSVYPPWSHFFIKHAWQKKRGNFLLQWLVPYISVFQGSQIKINTRCVCISLRAAEISRQRNMLRSTAPRAPWAADIKLSEFPSDIQIGTF